MPESVCPRPNWLNRNQLSSVQWVRGFDVNRLLIDLTGRLVILFLLLASTLFVLAGTLSWFGGWLFLILYFGFMIPLSLWLLRHDPGLLKERLQGLSRSDQKSWDKVLLAFAGILFLAWLAVMPVDVVRFHWSHMPMWERALGLAVLLCSFYFFYLVFRENSYLSPVVRLQHDRGQKVISSGPYHYVRHPMYSGVALFLIGTSVMLGSWFGLLVAMVLIGLIARRAVLEERVLRDELNGYAAYMTEVKYRLVPRIW